MLKKIDQAKLYKTQISLTEWFEKIGHSQTEELRLEDNLKRERLLILNEIINLPFNIPVYFQAEELFERSPKFKRFLKEQGNQLCGLRLLPITPGLGKIRTRGLSIKDSLDWFLKQEIDYKNYRAEFIRHSDKQLQSTIFVVNSQGIFGEIITGGHYQLTQGFYDSGHPITFSFDFKKLVLSEKNKKLQLYVKKLISIVKVSDIKLQKKLSKKLQAKFTNNYLNGYFETVDTEDYGLSFEDYNRILGDLYNTTVIPARRFEEASTLGVQAGIQKSHLKSGVKQVLHGHIACPGKVTGIVGQEILVCEMTTPDMVPQMKKAKGIITDFGGILSHAAIIARELNIPCLVGTKNATQILKAGYLIELDADQGVVRVASK